MPLRSSLFVLLVLVAVSNAFVEEETLKRKLAGEALIEIKPWTDEQIESGEVLKRRGIPIVEKKASDLELVELDEIQLASLRCRADACKDEECSCRAGFCKTDKEAANNDPVHYPTYNQVCDSKLCEAQQSLLELNEIYNEAVTYDNENGHTPNPVELVVFDMGNTKAAERLGVPLKNACTSKKIVTNAQPLTEAITFCDNMKNRLTRKHECNKNAVQDMVQKVKYFLCRDLDPSTDGCILILNPKDSASIEYLQLDNVPMAFVYGPPPLILSNYPFDISRSACNENRIHRPDEIKEVARENGRNAENLSACENCAASMAFQMQKVLQELKKPDEKRYAINTLDLPFDLDPVITDVCGQSPSKAVKSIMVANADNDMFGVSFSEYLEKKQASYDNDADCQEASRDMVTEFYEELESIMDAESKNRMLTKKQRMTDWP